MIFIRMDCNCVILILILLTDLKYSSSDQNENSAMDISNQPNASQRWPIPSQEIIVAASVCGNRIEQALAMMMSCLIFSPGTPIKFIIYTDNAAIFAKKLQEWQQSVNSQFKFETRDFLYPKHNRIEWRRLCWMCVCQRLFFPMLLPDVDALIYLDSDTIVLTPLEQLWKSFAEFNSSQIVGMAPDHELYKASPYGMTATHPIYGKSGVNSGVILMNLTRMRAFYWNEYVVSVYRRYYHHVINDQVIMNIIFHWLPDRLFLLKCTANYRAQFCDDHRPVCSAAMNSGVQVMHGTGGDFYNKDYPVFSAILKAARNYKYGTPSMKHFLNPLISYLKSCPKSYCRDVLNATIVKLMLT